VTLKSPHTTPNDVILPVAALAAEYANEAVDRFDPLDIFRLFVAELTLNAEP
jgi:hypothetical protein